MIVILMISINEIDTRSLGIIIMKKMKIMFVIYEEYYNITYDNKFGDAKEYGLREIQNQEIYKDIILDDIPMTIW